MYLIILIGPFLNFILLVFFGSKIGVKGSRYITKGILGLIFLLVFMLLVKNINENSIMLINIGFNVFKFNFFIIKWSFLFDSIGIIMLCLVSIISLLVHLYSYEYMKFDPHILRFISLLSLFTFFMFLLITASNFFIFFFGWEGVGLCSYLLVNFWFTRIEANKAALKAMLVNRIGDISLLIFIGLIYYIFKSVDYAVIFSLIKNSHNLTLILFNLNINIIFLLGVLLIIAAMGKSAQIGLHTWLPDAMEGPTPVSALIHAATMVTAGVFLLIRTSYILEYNIVILNSLVIIGGLTAFFSGLVAIYQQDIKKVIAYSTCSQLGYMIVACGLSKYDLALFHLFNHGFFKALLFLGAGIIIHALMDEQDMRKMGKLVYYIPIVYSSFFIATLAILGLPFLSGYFSKEVIINLAFSYYGNKYVFFAYIFVLMSVGLTVIYSLKILKYTFFDSIKGNKKIYQNIVDVNINNIFFWVLIILSFFSLISGFYFYDMFIGLGVNFFSGTIYILPSKYMMNIDYELIPSIIKLLPVVITLITIYLYNNFNFIKFNYKIEQFFGNKGYFDLLYNYVFINSLFYFSDKITYKKLDKNLFELIGVTGIYYNLKILINQYIYIYNSIFSGMIFLLIFSFVGIFLLYLNIYNIILIIIIIYYNILINNIYEN